MATPALFTCLLTCPFTWGPQGPPIFYLKAYLAFLPCQRLLSITFISLSFSQVPKAIAWALICLCKPSLDVLAIKAQPKSALVLICAYHIHAGYLNVFFPLGLGLGVPLWLVLGLACFLLTAGGFTWLLLILWLPQCQFAFVGYWWCFCNTL